MKTLLALLLLIPNFIHAKLSIDEKPSQLMNNKSDRYKNEVLNSETVSESNE